MRKHYHTLAVLLDGRWSPEFGDYDLETVKDERDDHRDSSGLPLASYRILHTEPAQAAINDALRALNEA